MPLSTLAMASGLGFRLQEKDVFVSTAIAVAAGDVVQLVLDTNGVFSTCTTAGAGNSAALTGGTYNDTSKTLSKTGAFASISPAPRLTLAITGATYTEATKTITKTGAFAAYTFYSTANFVDRFYVASGTNAVPGLYTVATRVSDDAITLTASIGATADAQTDIAGTVTTLNNRTRIKVTGGTAVTPGFYRVIAKVSDDLAVIDDIGTGAADVAFTVLDNTLMHGVFGVAMADAAANGRVRVRIMGRVNAFTLNTANAAIAAENLFAAVATKDLESDTASYGLNAKLIAKAIATRAVSTTSTRGRSLVYINGIAGFGGTYEGIA